ncbi:nuclear transport factor 2 family protein [Nocardia pneumoniae]|uniref:nuclear transport factor 2 family protein n=1 Tax=Nocardia pneumoniae TaxID=228601 RepID=UPI00031D4E30|nr:nuclear transport factor 2 family protein [Nocardia pneumoniae]
MRTRDEIEAFLDEYQQALSSFDAERSATLWGTPGTIVSDRFVGSLSSRAEMAQGLRQSYPFYRALGLASVDHTLLGQVEITERITRLRVRWHFFDNAGELLTDSDYEYLLRRDDDGALRVYVAVAIDEMRKLTELAAAKGIELPGA